MSEILLEEFYKTDLHVEKYHDRKIFLDTQSVMICGISQSGKTTLIKNYLLSLKKSSYLYIDCSDIRIEINFLNENLQKFCTQKKIVTLVFDNYNEDINPLHVEQLIVASQLKHKLDIESIELYPLDYEEFLAYEHKFDSSALNHFFQLGGLPMMHKISSDNRVSYVQQDVLKSLDVVEFEIVKYISKFSSQKISPFSIYERLKKSMKISKDRLYKSFEALVEKKYIHQLLKYQHSRASKKLYLCDISLKGALNIEKNFQKLFENMIYLELIKSQTKCYYDDGIDFYLPDSEEVILAMPFSDEKSLFKRVEKIEAFIFTHNVKKITAVTMNSEGSISHPLSKVEMLAFDIWAIGD